MLGLLRQSGRPVLITGHPRSGTTWAAAVLGAKWNVVVLHEPFNAYTPCPAWAYRFVRNYQYIRQGAQHPSLEPYRQLLRLRYSLAEQLRLTDDCDQVTIVIARWLKSFAARMLGCRVLVKDPMALLAAPRLAERFDMRVVVLIRHPAAFAASIKRLGWPFTVHELHEQRDLMHDRLEPYRDLIEQYQREPHTIFAHTVLLWRAFAHVIDQYRREHPDWLFVRHEDLSMRPIHEFRRIYDYVDMPFGDAEQAIVREHSSRQNPTSAGQAVHQLQLNSQANLWNWRHRLAETEITYVREQTAEEMARFYPEGDFWWQPPND